MNDDDIARLKYRELFYYWHFIYTRIHLPEDAFYAFVHLKPSDQSIWLEETKYVFEQE